ncbi:MAG TPA: hypothetical protein P5319_12095, partial [Gemmatimonadales bacterium]|nr:hypothetical protein [Gemmatimonadales bacterium]
MLLPFLLPSRRFRCPAAAGALLAARARPRRRRDPLQLGLTGLIIRRLPEVEPVRIAGARTRQLGPDRRPRLGFLLVRRCAGLGFLLVRWFGNFPLIVWSGVAPP